MVGIGAIINTLNNNGIKYKMEDVPGGLSCQFGVQHFDKKGAQVARITIDATDKLILTVGEKVGETNPEAVELLAANVVKYRKLMEETELALQEIVG